MAAHYSQVIKKMIQPADKMGSVIDSFDIIGQMLERVDKIRSGQNVTEEDVNYIIVNSLFSLGFYPFWNAHGGVLRPILLSALAKKGSAVENFFIEAIPMALTTAMPNRQMEYTDMIQKTIEAFEQ